MKVTYGVHFCMYLQNESLNTMTCNTCNIVGISSLRQNLLSEDVQDYENDCIYNLGFNNVVSTMDEAKDELLKRCETIDNQHKWFYRFLYISDIILKFTN